MNFFQKHKHKIIVFVVFMIGFHVGLFWKKYRMEEAFVWKDQGKSLLFRGELYKLNHDGDRIILEKDKE